MRQRLEFIAALLFLAALLLVSRHVSRYVSGAQVEAKKNMVILDPGHGGSDPGKIGVNGVIEKDVNLKIAKRTRDILKKKKIEALLTREEDTMLAGEGEPNKKVQDMKARVDMINRNAPSLAVSIHQNSYHQEEVSGAQVFYYTHSEKGKAAAQIMQEALLACDAENTRKAKANDTYYLLKRTEAPTMIVECGFLSNRREAKLLVSEDYQEKMAQAISKGIQACLEK